MKTCIYLYLAILIALCSAQLPVPIPSFNNLSAIQGEWYVVWSFVEGSEFPPQIEYSCYQWDISVDSDGGLIQAFVGIMGDKQHYNITIGEIESPNTIWNSNQSNSNFTWVALDPISQSWATIASTSSVSNYSSAYILSREPKLSSTLVKANIALLKGEKFPIKSGNQHGSLNDECPRNKMV